MAVEIVQGLIPGGPSPVFIAEIKDMAGSREDEELAPPARLLHLATEVLNLGKGSGPIFFPMNQQHGGLNMPCLVDGRSDPENLQGLLPV